MSPGLLRARAPFRTKNAVTGLILGAFTIGVYSYSIRAVKQERFDDIDEEARALHKTREFQTSVTFTPVQEKKAMEEAASSVKVVPKDEPK